MTRIHLDETRWPLLRVDYPTEQIDDEEWRQHLRKLEVHLLRQERFSLVLNMLDRSFDKDQRQDIGQVVDDHKVHCEKYLAGVAMVVGGKIQLAALNIISWVNKPTFPVHVFTELDAAEQWALDQIGGDDDRDDTTEGDEDTEGLGSSDP